MAPKYLISKVLRASQYLPLPVTMDRSGWKENSQWGGGRTGWNLFLVSRPLELHVGMKFLPTAKPIVLLIFSYSCNTSVPENWKIPTPSPGIDVQFHHWFECPQVSHLFGNCCLIWRTKLLWMWLFPSHFYEKEAFWREDTLPPLFPLDVREQDSRNHRAA